MPIFSRLEASRRPPSHDAATRVAYDFALFGLFGIGNFGNDATLEACVQGIRDVDSLARVLAVAPNPSGVEELFGIAAVRIRVPSGTTRDHRRVTRAMSLARAEFEGFLEAWRMLRQVRVLVVAGTGAFDDQHVSSRPALDTFRWVLAARMAGTQIAVLAVGAGPLDRTINRALVRTSAHLAHSVSYRDEPSRHFMRSIGRNVDHDASVPDLVLSWRPPFPVSDLGTSTPLRVAIGVLWEGNWTGRPSAYQRYLDSIMAMIEMLCAEGITISLVIGDEADRGTLDAVCGSAGALGYDVSAPTLTSFGDVLEVVSTCGAVVASRYHDLIAAVHAGRSVIALGYGPKHVALMQQLGSPHRAYDIDSFAAAEVVDQVRLALGDGPDPYRELLERARVEHRAQLEALCRG